MEEIDDNPMGKVIRVCRKSRFCRSKPYRAWNFLLFVVAKIRKIQRKSGRFAQILCEIGESSTKGDAMRTTFEKNLQLFHVPIEELQINEQSRDDIPRLLSGLKALYCDEQSRQAVLAHMEAKLSGHVRRRHGAARG